MRPLSDDGHPVSCSGARFTKTTLEAFSNVEGSVNIVAKVDRLMKLCDELEAKLRRAEDRASKLVEAVVQEMVA
jgi:hypothetical protein